MGYLLMGICVVFCIGTIIYACCSDAQDIICDDDYTAMCAVTDNGLIAEVIRPDAFSASDRNNGEQVSDGDANMPNS